MMLLNAHVLDCHTEKSAFYVDMNMDVYNISLSVVAKSVSSLNRPYLLFMP